MSAAPTSVVEIANAKNADERSVAGKIVTIQDAINAYRGHNAEAEGYRSLVTFLSDSGFNQPFKNDSYYDALVLTEAMLNRTNHSITVRTFTRRFTRCMIGYSKKLENHKYAVALFVWHFNFCRVHSAHRQTPAQAAGLTSEAFTIKDLLATATI